MGFYLAHPSSAPCYSLFSTSFFTTPQTTPPPHLLISCLSPRRRRHYQWLHAVWQLYIIRVHSWAMQRRSYSVQTRQKDILQWNVMISCRVLGVLWSQTEKRNWIYCFTPNMAELCILTSFRETQERLSGENIPRGSLMRGITRTSLHRHSRPPPKTMQASQSGHPRSRKRKTTPKYASDIMRFSKFFQHDVGW